MCILLNKWTRPGSLERRWLIVGVGFVLLASVPFALRWCDVLWRIRAARQALNEGQPARAVVILRKAESLEPGRPEILFLLGRALRRSGKLNEAVVYLDKAAVADWPEDEVRLQRQLLLAQTGAFAQAGDFNEIFARGVSDDTAEEIYEARAKGYYSAFRLGDALLCIDFWLQWRPHARQARIWRAEIYERMGRWKDTSRDYRAIVEHDPEDFESRIHLADALLALNDTRTALEEYEKCLAARPEETAALLGQSKCRRRLGEIADVSRRLSVLLDRQLTPRQRGDIFHELGELSLYNQAYEKAVEYLVQAQQADPLNWSVHHPLSIAYARLGMTELADRERRRGEQSVDRSKRLTEITEQVLKDPRNSELRYKAGMILIDEGLKAEGAAWLKTALEYEPDHRKTHEALAEYCDEIGDDAGARHHRIMAGRADKLEPADEKADLQ